MWFWLKQSLQYIVEHAKFGNLLDCVEGRFRVVWLIKFEVATAGC
jgi:hypothetical protein